VVLVQDQHFEALDSVTVVPLTTDQLDLPYFRISVAPNERNGLRLKCFLMADKVTTMSKRKLSAQIGELGNSELQRLDRALLVFLGLSRPLAPVDN